MISEVIKILQVWICTPLFKLKVFEKKLRKNKNEVKKMQKECRWFANNYGVCIQTKVEQKHSHFVNANYNIQVLLVPCKLMQPVTQFLHQAFMVKRVAKHPIASKTIPFKGQMNLLVGPTAIWSRLINIVMYTVSAVMTQHLSVKGFLDWNQWPGWRVLPLESTAMHPWPKQAFNLGH